MMAVKSETTIELNIVTKSSNWHFTVMRQSFGIKKRKTQCMAISASSYIPIGSILVSSIYYSIFN